MAQTDLHHYICFCNSPNLCLITHLSSMELSLSPENKSKWNRFLKKKKKEQIPHMLEMLESLKFNIFFQYACFPYSVRNQVPIELSMTVPRQKLHSLANMNTPNPRYRGELPVISAVMRIIWRTCQNRLLSPAQKFCFSRSRVRLKEVYF